MKLFYFIFLFFYACCLHAKTCFVATNGCDLNKGTIDSPFATLNKAYSMEGVDTIYFRAGVYVITEEQIMEKTNLYARVFKMSRTDCSVSKRLYIGGYQLERPVFDLSQVRPQGLRVCVFYVDGSCHHFNNFEVVGTQVTLRGHTQSECFRNEGGNYNIYENMKVCQKAHLLCLAQSPDFHKLGLCYYLKILYL